MTNMDLPPKPLTVDEAVFRFAAQLRRMWSALLRATPIPMLEDLAKRTDVRAAEADATADEYRRETERWRDRYRLIREATRRQRSLDKRPTSRYD